MYKGGQLKAMFEQQLLSLHTAYIGKVLKYADGKADIQPLMMIKQYGKPAEAHSPLPNVPVIDSARYKAATRTVSLYGGGSITYLEPTPLSVGDVVVCVCCERDITEAKNGVMAQQPIGHHSLSDSIVVGIL